MKAPRSLFDEHTRRREQAMIDDIDRVSIPKPTTLYSLLVDERAAATLLNALHDQYFYCMASGRLDVWARAAHSTIDLLAMPHTAKRIVPRDRLDEVLASEQGTEDCGNE